MSEQQPELRWTPIPPKPRERGRIWAIVGLIVLALAITGTLLWFVLAPRQGDADATPTPTVSTSADPTSSATPSPGATSTSTPSTTPEVTPPAVPNPDLETFTVQVQPRLDDATTGLTMLQGISGSDAVQIVDQLQQDAERLSDTIAPSSIATSWASGVFDYANALRELRTAIDTQSPVDPAAATEALNVLRDLAGL